MPSYFALSLLAISLGSLAYAQRIARWGTLDDSSLVIKFGLNVIGLASFVVLLFVMVLGTL